VEIDAMKAKLKQIILGLTIFGALFAEANVCVAALENLAQELTDGIESNVTQQRIGNLDG
jgi:hypothetical protein